MIRGVADKWATSTSSAFASAATEWLEDIVTEKTGNHNYYRLFLLFQSYDANELQFDALINKPAVTSRYDWDHTFGMFSPNWQGSSRLLLILAEKVLQHSSAVNLHPSTCDVIYVRFLSHYRFHLSSPWQTFMFWFSTNSDVVNVVSLFYLFLDWNSTDKNNNNNNNFNNIDVYWDVPGSYIKGLSGFSSRLTDSFFLKALFQPLPLGRDVISVLLQI